MPQTFYYCFLFLAGAKEGLDVREPWSAEQQIPLMLFLQKGMGCGQCAEFLLVDSASFEAISWLQMTVVQV